MKYWMLAGVLVVGAGCVPPGSGGGGDDDAGAADGDVAARAAPVDPCQPDVPCIDDTDCPDGHRCADTLDSPICLKLFCGEDNDPCSADEFCSDGRACVRGYCVTVPAGSGEACAVTEHCADDLICNTGFERAQCTSRPAEGERCGQNADCVDGLTCIGQLTSAVPEGGGEREYWRIPGTGRCTPRVGCGYRCDDSGDCISSTCTDPDAYGICSNRARGC